MNTALTTSHIFQAVLAVSGAAFAPAMSFAVLPSAIVIEDHYAFPESLTSTTGGDVILSSLGTGAIFRAAAGSAKPVVWIAPGTNGLLSVFGVLADEHSQTLWACSSPRADSPAAAGAQSALKAFDLKTGKPKGSFAFPPGKALCNDIAVGRDGSAYATDTINGRVLRLKRGSHTLEIWAEGPPLAGSDGLAFGGNGALYVNTLNTGHLLRIDVLPNGAAGVITELQTSRPLTRPDGMRPFDGKFLLIEGAGRLDEVAIDGDRATVRVLQDGYTSPTAVTIVAHIAWVLESNLAYFFDPKLRGQDAGPFRASSLPLERTR